MRRLFAITLAITLALSIAAPAVARGATLDPTIVTVNADGTVTATTTATPKFDHVWLFITGTDVRTGETRTEACIVDPSGITADGTTATCTFSTASPQFLACPCVVWFAETNNYFHWHQYSATSEPFTI